MKRIHKTIAASIAALCLLAPGAAMAQSSSVEGYTEPRAEIEANSSGPRTPADNSREAAPANETTAPAAGTLPFTGLDLGLMAAGGVVLAGMGFGMRRLSQAPDAA